MYLWFKLLHVFFVISWFAGLFYLPRIFVNLAQVEAAEQPVEYERLSAMSRRLYKFMSPLGFGNAGVRHCDSVCDGLVGAGLAACEAVDGPAAFGLSILLRRAASRL